MFKITEYWGGCLKSSLSMGGRKHRRDFGEVGAGPRSPVWDDTPPSFLVPGPLPVTLTLPIPFRAYAMTFIMPASPRKGPPSPSRPSI